MVWSYTVPPFVSPLYIVSSSILGHAPVKAHKIVLSPETPICAQNFNQGELDEHLEGQAIGFEGHPLDVGTECTPVTAKLVI